MKPKILITGGESFFAKSIKHSNLFSDYDLHAPSRHQLDILDLESLSKELEKNYDTVIHCAAQSGWRNRQKSSDDFYENILMLENLLALRGKYDKLITFGSGSEYDRNFNIEDQFENTETNRVPTDFYSLSKLVQTQLLKNAPGYNMNLRLFGCFGIHESNDRFIKTSIKNYINKKDIEIWENFYFSYFYILDLLYIIKFSIEHPLKGYHETNCVYEEKLKLSDIANKINQLSEHKINVKVLKEIDKNYHGKGFAIQVYKGELKGLDFGINEMYNLLLSEK